KNMNAEFYDIEKQEDSIFLTLMMLISLDHQNHRGASETYSKLGETLVGEKLYHEFYEKCFMRKKDDRKCAWRDCNSNVHDEKDCFCNIHGRIYKEQLWRK
ncbi:unnamed protein product, partial [marine sediment metagenome]